MGTWRHGQRRKSFSPSERFLREISRKCLSESCRRNKRESPPHIHMAKSESVRYGQMNDNHFGLMTCNDENVLQQYIQRKDGCRRKDPRRLEMGGEWLSSVQYVRGGLLLRREGRLLLQVNWTSESSSVQTSKQSCIFEHCNWKTRSYALSRHCTASCLMKNTESELMQTLATPVDYTDTLIFTMSWGSTDKQLRDDYCGTPGQKRLTSADSADSSCSGKPQKNWLESE